MNTIRKLRPIDPPAPAADVFSSLGRYLKEHGGAIDFGPWTVCYDERERTIGPGKEPGTVEVETVDSYVLQKGWDRTSVLHFPTAQEAVAYALEQEGWV